MSLSWNDDQGEFGQLFRTNTANRYGEQKQLATTEEDQRKQPILRGTLLSSSISE
ncbi:hypothetical protein AB4354_02525 [Vibrio splendidus]|uniref:hypothetical protein n=1 Tax=Vibrio splendidus TaxID=29497 RepID=UPI0012FFEB3C|nr:hypothetical protein [Vibrio splendidus]